MKLKEKLRTNKFIRVLSVIAKLPQYMDSISKDMEILSDRIRDTHVKIDDVSECVTNLAELNVSSQYIDKMNLLLSINPVIWGPKKRLHISKLADVSSCRFNTNSGNIYVGDYTFSGMNVSLLAGSHDKNITGLARREAEYTVGYDIVIGDGVWLASNCVIMGPCTIGNNAIIAAGAIVIPGTDVPPNSIYGGVPARLIGTVDSNDIYTDYYKEAVERMNGVLFLDGWSNRCVLNINEADMPWHYLISERADLLTNQAVCVLNYSKETVDTVSVSISIERGDTLKFLLDSKEGNVIMPVHVGNNGEPVRLTVCIEQNRESICWRKGV